MSCQPAAVSTTGSGAGTPREASQRREVSWGRQPVSTGMPRSPSRAWLMWTEISGRPERTHAPHFLIRVTITWRHSLLPSRRSSVTPCRDEVDKQPKPAASNPWRTAPLCLLGLGQGKRPLFSRRGVLNPTPLRSPAPNSGRPAPPPGPIPPIPDQPVDVTTRNDTSGRPFPRRECTLLHGDR